MHRKFQQSIRELFLSKDMSLASNYLRFLVQDITVRGAEITIRGRTNAAVALLATGAESGTSLNHPPPVLTSVGGWRPNGDPSKNFTSAFVIDLERERKRRQSRELRVPRIVRLLDHALEFQRLLDSGKVRFRADLARHSGLSAMRVTQILALLRLAPRILDYVRSLPPGTAARAVTERALRPLTYADGASQVHEAARLLPGFARFARRTGS